MNSTVIAFPAPEPFIPTPGKVPAKLHSLASGVMFKLQIHPDRSLVSVLGTGREYSNHDAIITWLLQNYELDQIEQMHTPLDQLTSALYSYLNDHLNTQENLPC